MEHNNQTFRPSSKLNTAVLFIVFKRLHTTRQVFDVIRKAKPPRLYIASDGAREGRADEEEQVIRVRDYVMNNIDWECEVKTLFREKNIGCKYGPGNAIKWFFEHEEMGIILEDDCLPVLSFFWYCEELLNRYKHSENIGVISGRNHLEKYRKIKGCDFFITTRGATWGWATWKRSVDIFDIELGSGKGLRIYYKILANSGSFLEFIHMSRSIRKIRAGTVSAWDYQWNIAQLFNKKLALIPTRNMIKNIGFGDEATHTTYLFSDPLNSYDVNIPLHSVNPPFDPGFSKKTYFNDAIVKLKKHCYQIGSLFRRQPLKKVTFFPENAD
ncbi:protein containing nucleotide-diphospho-sugar transferase domain [Chitinispirillum alkaliphilum]|nr:protein containing nucleotide-diphospho-sugar transferase domain [Chitinispirillum alkaliphilum]